MQLRSIINSADNTGASRLSFVKILGGSKKKFARVGDAIICVVKEADPLGMVKKHELVKAVIVRTRKEFRRIDGSYIRFDDNAAVLIDNPKDKNPVGTRIFGPIARELKDLNYTKIVSMAEEVF